MDAESNGYKVLIAADGRQAVEIYKKQYKVFLLFSPIWDYQLREEMNMQCSKK